MVYTPAGAVVEAGDADLPPGLGLQQTFLDKEQQDAEKRRQQDAEICKSLFEQNLQFQQALARA